MEQDKSEEKDEVEWLRPGITVRIKPHEIDEIFHGKKVVITRIVEPYVGEVTVGTATIQLDQAHLETIIPKAGHRVMVVQGRHGGEPGVLKSVNLAEGYGVVELASKEVQIPFNHFTRYDKEQQ